MSMSSLGQKNEELVRKLVADGRYASPDEVMQDGLRLLAEREARMDTLRQHLADGLASGPPEPMDMNAIKSEARLMREREAAAGRDA